jgi:tetratricopeptide (TPR) repeat protein
MRSFTPSDACPGIVAILLSQNYALKPKKEGVMKIQTALVMSSLIISLSACASLRVGNEVQSGRRALLIGQNEEALAYFQSAAKEYPNYTYGTAMRHSVLSYLGRSEYATGRYPQARQTLEKVLVANKDDDVSRLYLGLTLARSGDRQQGLNEIQNGMKGINDWIEYITQAHRFSFGQFWDPNREIRGEIQNNLAMISKREFDWDKLLVNGEWIGKEIEAEGDRARQDEVRDRNRDSEGNDGTK